MKLNLLLLFLFLITAISFSQEWQLPSDHMFSRWAKEVTPANVLFEYPRPQMVREEWLNLNGLWDFALVDTSIKPGDEKIIFADKILVPFPVESSMSGIKGTVTAEDMVIYRKSFTLPETWAGKRVLLNFDAVDWKTTVWLNDYLLGSHKGGYDSFTFDLSEYLNEAGEQVLTVAVWDPTDEGHQPVGKQTTDTRGFWYTANTGIWQTVWLEPVDYQNGNIENIKTTTDIDNGTVTVLTNIAYRENKHRVKVTASSDGKVEGVFTGLANQPVTLTINNPQLWSPENPFLYDLTVELIVDGETVDKVESYFGMRKISTMKDEKGILRLALNNEIYFQFGMLDQGWWPEGLYRAPTDDALKFDIEVAKQLGFNMLRKHGKMEPERWYHWCDKLGMLVWQDMTPGDIEGEYGTDRSQESKDQFELEYSEMIDQLFNYPSIVTWVIFNEGWGQYDTERLVNKTRELDPGRLVVGASGFVDEGVGDILDVHAYPGPAGAALDENRPTTLGEFGGLGFPVKGHLWDAEKAWGYVRYENVDELSDAYEALIHRLKPYVSEGICAAIYTQVTDVENEVNGMMTYDREFIKMDPDRLKRLSAELHAVKPGSYKFMPIINSSQDKGQTWKYTFDKPDEDWSSDSYDDSNWKSGQGGFGDTKDHNPVIRTLWKNEEIWLRKRFEYDADEAGTVVLKVFNQFEAEAIVYLNGEKIAEAPEHSNSYTIIELDKKAVTNFIEGENVIAVHSRQNNRRAYLDVGMYFLTHPDKQK